MNNIGWCDFTHNLITGCLNHKDGYCKGGLFPCYAYKLANTRLRERYMANENIAPVAWCNEYAPLDPLTPKCSLPHERKKQEALIDPFYPRFWPDRLNKKFPKGSKVFLNDVSDWLGIGIPDEWIRATLEYMKSQPDVNFLTLTKQPQNLSKWEFPDNCWVGVTATWGQPLADAGFVLEKIRATVKFVSIEPLLRWDVIHPQHLSDRFREWFNWLIIGACTGTKQEMLELQKKYPELTVMPFEKKWTAQPKIEWVKEIVEAADKAGIPVWLKDNLEPLFVGRGLNEIEGLFVTTHKVNTTETSIGYKYEWKLRQEFPNV